MSDPDNTLEKEINRVANKIGQTWPLYSFVTSNPLSGLVDQSFKEAVAEARSLFGGRGFPAASQFRQALEQGWIDRTILKDILRERGLDPSIENHLESLKDAARNRSPSDHLEPADRKLNQVLEKWLSSFLDEGQSGWSMPGREQGFYRAWKQVAPFDHQIPDADSLSELPEEAPEVLHELLSDYSDEDRSRIFTYHLTALPDWVGYIKQRNNRSDDPWAQNYPIQLSDYLAVRLILADQLDATILPDVGSIDPKPVFLDDVRHAFLEAWEATYRDELVSRLNLQNQDSESTDEPARPEAQMVFCIDTRSEIIRRHIEATGPYETHGYAGFFGVPVRHRRHGQSSSVEACPPIVEPEHDVRDVPRTGNDDFQVFEYWSELNHRLRGVMKNVKDNIASAFNYVELSGLFYGLGMAGKTLMPGTTRSMSDGINRTLPDYNDVTEPTLDHVDTEEKVEYAAAAFELMGWDTFAPLVVFVGHTSDTSNNPFDSSLQCGACSGNSGVPNARILAAICNETEVREQLNKRGFEIPEDTMFLAGQHNTTTDEIRLLETADSQEHAERIDTLKSDLEEARRRSVSERMRQMPELRGRDGTEVAEQRAADWAQTRPEWGLAGNASFIVGPNRLREGADLGGRAFLHSYDWRQDPDGSSLRQIMEGPVVVCQWINHQYYFSAIDNRIYGSGSKITHNPVGNFGVLQGNGGALMGGLPLQSLMKSDTELQHAPLRILTLIHAPLARVESVLDDVETVKNLVANDWFELEVIDPERDNQLISLSDRMGSTEEDDVNGRTGVR